MTTQAAARLHAHSSGAQQRHIRRPRDETRGLGMARNLHRWEQLHLERASTCILLFSRPGYSGSERTQPTLYTMECLLNIREASRMIWRHAGDPCS